MALFSAATFAGPSISSLVAGFTSLKESWRWTFYVLLCFGGITEILMFTIPETLPSAILYHKARRLRCQVIPGYENVLSPIEASGKRDLAAMFRVTLSRPFKILIDPISFLVAIYISVVYILHYMLFTIYPIVFLQKRGWNSGVGELPLVGAVVGAATGGAIVFAASNHDNKRMLAGIKPVPEDRLPLAMGGGISFAVFMFWFAWAGEFDSVHWSVVTLAGTFLATSILLIFVAYINYLTDTYLEYTASAMAANTICRSACDAAALLFTQSMFDALGVGGGGSLIGGVAVLLVPIPFVFYKYGAAIRQRSKFAPTPSPPKDEMEIQGDVESGPNAPNERTLNAEISDDGESDGGLVIERSGHIDEDTNHVGAHSSEITGK